MLGVSLLPCINLKQCCELHVYYSSYECSSIIQQEAYLPVLIWDIYICFISKWGWSYFSYTFEMRILYNYFFSFWGANFLLNCWGDQCSTQAFSSEQTIFPKSPVTACLFQSRSVISLALKQWPCLCMYGFQVFILCIKCTDVLSLTLLLIW